MTGYNEICSLCQGNGYIKLRINTENQIKQCWVCESKGEKHYTQAEVDDFIYKTYYKKGIKNKRRKYGNNRT